MKENKYDDEKFFNKYKNMGRSIGGLDSSGEWHEFKRLFKDIEDKRILDLGCGFGWHLRYAIDHGAKCAVGVDISEKMIQMAKEKTSSDKIKYVLMPIEDINFPKDSFDIVISSLAFHYIKSFKDICLKIKECLVLDGKFIFSVEHPIFTAEGSQSFFYNEEGTPIHWPIDRYFEEGLRETNFLGEKIIKYHRTLTTYIDDLLQCGFTIKSIIEPKPEPNLLNNLEMKNELRRPMMLIISSEKNF